MNNCFAFIKAHRKYSTKVGPNVNCRLWVLDQVLLGRVLVVWKAEYWGQKALRVDQPCSVTDSQIFLLHSSYS